MIENELTVLSRGNTLSRTCFQRPLGPSLPSSCFLPLRRKVKKGDVKDRITAMSGSLGIIILNCTNESGRSSALFLFCALSSLSLPSLNVRNKLREGGEGEVIMAANHASDFRPQPRYEIAIHNELLYFWRLERENDMHVNLNLERGNTYSCRPFINMSVIMSVIIQYIVTTLGAGQKVTLSDNCPR